MFSYEIKALSKRTLEPLIQFLLLAMDRLRKSKIEMSWLLN